jgi:hypothetical protein
MSRGGIILTVLLMPLAAALGVLWALDEDVFAGLRLSGPPLVVAEGERPAVLFLTVHRETGAWLPSLIASAPRRQVHVDLWARAARDLTPLWVRRVASTPDERGIPAAAITGATERDVRVEVAGRPAAFALADGTARPAAGEAVIRPMQIDTDGTIPMRMRGTVIGGTAWYGMVQPEEAAALARDMTEPDWRRAAEYRLWTARVSERHNFVFNTVERRYMDLRQTLAGPAFLRGGLLTWEVGDKREPVVLDDPTRLVVLHDREDAGETWRYLTCLRTDGGVCWDVRLGLTRMLGVASAQDGQPDEQTLVVLGGRQRPGDPAEQATQMLVSVGTREGTMNTLVIGTLDLHALKLKLAR